MSNNAPAVSDTNGDVLPPEPHLKKILGSITVALADLPGADAEMIFHAHATLENQFSKGRKRGLDEGFRRGFDNGYREGLEDGMREACDKIAREEAERVVIKAAARAGGGR